MKITFEGKTFDDILDAIENVLTTASKKYLAKMSENGEFTAGVSMAEAQGPGPETFAMAEDPTVDNPVDIPVDKPKPAARKHRATKPVAAAKPEPAPAVEKTQLDPAAVVKLRQKTIEDLQSAYANGYQKEVFELLARFGNGAKSFRELPPDAFVPIREAIDNGALT